MSDKDKKTAAPPTGAPAPQIEMIIEALGLIINNAQHNYWLSKSDEKQTYADGYALLSAAFESCPEIELRIRGGLLTANGHDVSLRGSLQQMFVAQLTELEILDFALTKGLPLEGFTKLMGILSLEKDQLAQQGGFTNAVQQFSIPHVRARHVVLKEVTDGDMIVSLGPGTTKAGIDEASVGTIVAFLKGESGDPNAENAAKIREAASHPEKLAELMLKAAEIRQREGGSAAGGETLGDIVVGVIRRTIKALKKSPGAETQGGRKELRKNLLLLEKETLDALRGPNPSAAAESAEAIAEAFHENEKEIRMEGLLSEYAKKQQALARSEKRLVRYLRASPLDDKSQSQVEAQLDEMGIPLEGWQELVVKSSAPRKVQPAAAGLSDVRHLATLLSRMEQMVGELQAHPEKVSDDEFSGVIRDVNREIGDMVQGTRTRIQNIVEEARKDAKATDEIEQEALKQGIGLHMTRKKLLELLAEIVQELCQPLAVINCSIDMIFSRRLGDVTDRQAEILRLATDSSQKLQSLVDSLKLISGVPESLSPDFEMLQSVARKAANRP